MMKTNTTTASVEAILHKDKQRIKVIITNQAKTKALIKQVEGRRWSQSKCCWHIPYTRTAYQQLKELFDEVLVIKKEGDGHDFQKNLIEDITKHPQKKPASVQHTHFIRVEIEGEEHMKIFVPYWRKNEIKKVKTIQGRTWNVVQKYWSVPMTREVVAQLNTWFEGELVWGFEVEEKLPQPYSVKTNLLDKIVVPFRKVEVGTPVPVNKTPSVKQIKTEGLSKIPIPIPTEVCLHSYQKDGQLQTFVVGQRIVLATDPKEQYIYAFVPFDKKAWQETVRNVPGRKWLSIEKCWRLPYVKASFRLLKKYVGMEYLWILFRINVDIPENFISIKSNNLQKQKSKIQLNAFQKKAVIALEEKMLLEHKAWRTRKTYKSLFTKFLIYYPDSKPSTISKKQIERYIIYRKQDNISDSQLNQLINTLNCFFIRILNQKDKVSKLERPKKKRDMPNVFSLEEIERLLKVTINLKHKCILILIYSAGLRKGEVLNLRVSDLSFDRKSIYIHKGKGGKDRYTFFADLARKYLEKYLKQYQPTHYLFEGEKGGRYGESTLQTIFEKSRKSSKVNRNVTIHGLRHSFATHLVEKGVPLHVVQDLLGHYSIKTTEIYLHISNKFRKDLKSPLDDLDI